MSTTNNCYYSYPYPYFPPPPSLQHADNIACVYAHAIAMLHIITFHDNNLLRLLLLLLLIIIIIIIIVYSRVKG